MGYKKTDPCIQKAFDDERLFVLMARDATAPSVICEWIKNNINTQPPDKLHEALDCAIEMALKCNDIKAKVANQRDKNMASKNLSF